MDLVSQLRSALQAQTDVSLAMLFGSQATGRARPDSDIDLAVILDGGDPLELASVLSRALGLEVDVVDLASAGYPLVKRLLAEGVLVREGRPGVAAQWRSRALADAETDRPWFERQREGFLRRLAGAGSP